MNKSKGMKRIMIVLAVLIIIAVLIVPLAIFLPYNARVNTCKELVTHVADKYLNPVTPNYWMNMCAMYVPSKMLNRDMQSHTLIGFTTQRNALYKKFYRFFGESVPGERPLVPFTKPLSLKTPEYNCAINDVRLFMYKENLMGITSACNVNFGAYVSVERPVFVTFNLNSNSHSIRNIVYDNPGKRDKNWCPMIPINNYFYTDHRDSKEIIFRYIDGIETDTPTELKEKQIQIPYVWSNKDTLEFGSDFKYQLRGSTPWIEVRTGVYWGFVHFGKIYPFLKPLVDITIGISGSSMYRHVLLEIDLNSKQVLRQSKFLCFDEKHHNGCQFAVGFYPSPISPDTFILSGGVNNMHNFIQEYTRDDLEKLLSSTDNS